MDLGDRCQEEGHQKGKNEIGRHQGIRRDAESAQTRLLAQMACRSPPLHSYP